MSERVSSNRFKNQEHQERVESHNAIMRNAANVLAGLGMPTASEYLLALSDETKMTEFMEMAIQAGIQGEREKIHRHHLIARWKERLEDRIAYEMALASVGTGGWTTQGYRVFNG